MRGAERLFTLAIGVLVAAVAVLWFLGPWGGGAAVGAVDPQASPGAADPVQVAAIPGETAAEDAGASERVAVPAAAGAERAAPSPVELWGRVVRAADGSPIAGADVRLLYRDADEFWNLDREYGAQIDELDHTASDADGRFRFGVARARQHRLRVSADGYATATVLDCTGGSEVVVELSSGAAIEGVVRCEGAGVPDVPVRIAVRGASLELASLRTGRNGAFHVAGLLPAEVFVQVSSPEHDVVWKRLDLEDGQTHTVEIELTPGKTLRGRVIDAASEQPIAGAEVSDSWTFERRVVTSADGRFELGGLGDDGFVEVGVRADGYARAARNLTGELGEEVEFALVRGGEVTGRFVDEAGAPVGGVYAAVGASYMASPGMQSTDWIRADVRETGVFAALGLRTDQHYWLYVRGRGYGSRVYALPRRLEAGERVEVGDVVLRPAGGVEGRVANDRGEPLAGVEVSIRGHNADASAWVDERAHPTEVLQFVDRDVETDGQGAFRFTDLAEGSYDVVVHAHGRPFSAKAEVRAGAITENVELTVAIGLRITGTLGYANGRAPGDEAAQLRLSAWREGGRSSRATVGRDGAFAFTGLDAGEYVIALPSSPEGWALRPVRGVAAGRADVRLQLEPASFIAGRVLDAEGNPARARIYVRYAEPTWGGSPLQATDDEGRFRVEVPPDFRGTVGAVLPKQIVLGTHLDGVTAGQKDLELRLGH